MNLNFTKMQSLGNDFVVIDAVNQSFDMTKDLAAQLANRQLGIGCDQILLAERATSLKADFKFRIFNADGSEVSQCGNGARCLGLFIHDQALSDSMHIRLETLNNPMMLLLREDGTVTVEMGVPEFEPARIPFLAEKRLSSYHISVGDSEVDIVVLAIGNPHAVQIVADIHKADADLLGPLIESHQRFPERVNAGFMQILSPTHIRLRVYERGVGETLACGSGACAAVVAGISLGHLQHCVTVSLPGGDVDVAWEGENRQVMLSGPAHTVFKGSIHINQM